MNKKLFVALILPLMLLPLASFGAAHLYDTVEKKYKLYIGKMCADITYFHVDLVRLIDKDNDGDLFDDELKIEVVTDPSTGLMTVRILVNPVSPNFVLDTTMNITNCGDLPWTVTWVKEGSTYWPLWNNGTSDPCWDSEPTKDFPLWPSALWSWEIHYYKINATGKYPATPTQYVYKPGDVFQVVQHIDLKQPETTAEAIDYKKIMGTWFWIWEKWSFETEDPITDSCWTYTPPVV